MSYTDDYPDQEVHGEELKAALAALAKLEDDELEALVGGIVGELVNRGNDHETAVETVQDAAYEGAAGSRTFDAMVS